MILLLMIGISLLTMLLKKSMHNDNDRTNCNDTCTANVIRELCHLSLSSKQRCLFRI